MKLSIRYTPVVKPVTAAFIRGTGPAAWLDEISQWKTPSFAMECYIVWLAVPDKPAGLLVVFQNKQAIPELMLAEPYICAGNNLYIPQNAELIPRVKPDELKNLLIWQCQVFHPVHGFTGFEQKDRVELADFLLYPEPLAADWSFADPGLPARPVFDRINIIQQDTADLMNDMKADIGQKPLKEIPAGKDEKNSFISKALEEVKFRILKAVLDLLELIGRMIPEADTRTSYRGQRGGSLIQQFYEWLSGNVKDMQQRRNKELERLLKLFEENNKEALQYAIPLDSPYLNRGTDARSSRLSRRNLNFDASRLGGGQAIDGWDVGNYYSSLKNKYLDSARKATGSKDFKKAAYIYAHLLGDYRSAANVLMQGGFYREAATLYKDHLKDIVSAAECLEKGGLYHEAITLFTDMERYEKVGDIYDRLDNRGEAMHFYEKHLVVLSNNNNFLDAGKLVLHKMKEPERSRQVFLEGWKQSLMGEACLNQYFDIVLSQEPQNMGKQLHHIYTLHTARHKRSSLLQVMENVNRKITDEHSKSELVSIAYQLVHEEAEKGNYTPMKSLANIISDDKLILSDTTRYIGNRHAKKTESQSSQVFYLDNKITWLKAIFINNQFLAIGTADSHLHLARGNIYGNLEYFSWTNPVKPQTRFSFVCTPHYADNIILHASEGLPITRKNLLRNKYFAREMTLYCPVWLHKIASLCVMRDAEHICVLTGESGNMVLHRYDIEGNLQQKLLCIYGNGQQMPDHPGLHKQLAYGNGCFFACRDKSFISILEDGTSYEVPFGTIIRLFAVSASNTDPYIVISTNSGCLLCKPSNGELPVTETFFATDITPNIISFVSGNHFVIASRKRAVLYEIINDRAHHIKAIETQSSIIAALPSGNRYQMLLIEENGMVTFHSLAQET